MGLLRALGLAERAEAGAGVRAKNKYTSSLSTAAACRLRQPAVVDDSIIPSPDTFAAAASASCSHAHLCMLCRRRSQKVAVSKELPDGGPGDERGGDYTVLQRHVEFFDRDNDGIITPLDTFAGFRRVAQRSERHHAARCRSLPAAHLCASQTHRLRPSHLVRRSAGHPRHVLHSDVAERFAAPQLSHLHRAHAPHRSCVPALWISRLVCVFVCSRERPIHYAGADGSDSRVLDSEGRFVPQRFEVRRRYEYCHTLALC